MRHIGMDSIRKVPIRQPSISDILEFQSETDRRQTTIFGHLHALFSLTDGQFMHSNALAVLIGSRNISSMLRETDWAEALHKELKKKIPLKKFVLVLSYSHSSTSNQPVTFYRCQTSSALWPHGYSQNTLQGAPANTHIKSGQRLHPINRVSNRYRLNILCNDNRETLLSYYIRCLSHSLDLFS